MTDKSLYGMFKYEHSIHPKKHPSYSLAHLLSVANGYNVSKLWVFQGGVGAEAASRRRTGGFAFKHEAAPRKNEEVAPTVINNSDQLWSSRMAWVGTRNSRFLEMTHENMELDGG